MIDEIEWTRGQIDGCSVTSLKKFADERGWLAEFFRQDELPAHLHPVMGYLSLTRAGVSRGPHEHESQTDLFLFFNGEFRVYLWDTRTGSETRHRRLTLMVGAKNPVAVIIPPGVVHAYWNVGDDDAYVINCPNRLYRGPRKAEPVDEIRYEDVADSPFRLD